MGPKKEVHEHRVELTPAVGEFAGQIAFYAIIRTDEAFRKTLLCVTAAFAEHEAILFHKSKESGKCMLKRKCY